MDEPELLDEKQLLRRTQQAFENAKGSQSDVARALGLNRSSVSRALRNEGLKHAAVQARVVSLLEKVPVQRRSTYEGSKVAHEWVIDPERPTFEPPF
jgi:transcriptional regulator with XRE-family HTH domain